MMEKAVEREKNTKNTKGGCYAGKNTQIQSNTQSNTTALGKEGGETEKKQKTKKKNPEPPWRHPRGGGGGEGWLRFCFGLSLDEWEGKGLLIY